MLLPMIWLALKSLSNFLRPVGKVVRCAWGPLCMGSTLAVACMGATLDT